ncbi:MAG TPA: tetratricopeptide repeat protein, partial [Candidatus Eisenbacteria bacterium]|nr:tetratricopeptide repeat protein [Candidatus Eisenbacteria bacterium]
MKPAAWRLLALLLVAPGRAAAATPGSDAREAERLHQLGLAHAAERTFEGRRRAITELERATLLDPSRSAYWLDLGRLCLEAGHRSRGRSCYERATQVTPDDAEAQTLLGMAWKWEWLSSFDDAALVR